MMDEETKHLVRLNVSLRLAALLPDMRAAHKTRIVRQVINQTKLRGRPIMEPTYYIYSTRAQGWVNRGGTYGTQLEEAKTFPATEAFAYCKRANNADTLPVMIPVETSSAVAAGFSK